MIEGRAEEARWSLDGFGQSVSPERVLETIPAPRLPVSVTLTCDEITTMDPRTHQPDFVVATIRYGPRRLLIDSKSLHDYIVRLRPRGYSMERLATIMAADVLRASEAAWVDVTIAEKPRGGIAITAQCRLEHPSPVALADAEDPYAEWERSH